MKFRLVKQNGNFIPATDEDREKVNKISEGEVFTCQTIDQRNYEHHKKYFALINFAFENLPEKYDEYFLDPEDLREELLKAIGWKKTHKNFRGETVTKAKSISFSEVGQERFDTIYNRTLDVVFRMLGIDEDSEIVQELLNF